MGKGTSCSAWSFFLAIAVCAVPSRAQTDARVHIGLDTSIYSTTSVEGTTTASATSTNSAKVVANESVFGLPGYTAFTLGALLGDCVDLGTRLAYRSRTTKVGSDATPDHKESLFLATPYLAFLAGNRHDSVRPILGVLAGFGTGTASSSSTDASGSSEVTLSSTEFGAFVGLRGFTGEVMSLDPTVLIARDSSTYEVGAGAKADMTGVSFMVNLGFSLWSRDTPPAAPKSAAPPKPAITDETEFEGFSRPRPTPVVAAPTYRITLNLEAGRQVIFVRKPKSEEPDVAIALRDGDNDIGKSGCSEVTLHSANSEDSTLDVEPGMASTGGRRFPVLRGLVTPEQIRALAAAPIASDAAAPDHWIDVCGQRWTLLESERRRLKKYALGLPRSAPSPSVPIESTTPAQIDTKPADPWRAEPAPAQPTPEAAPADKSKK